MWLVHTYTLLFMACAPGATDANACARHEVPGFVSHEACRKAADATARSMLWARRQDGTDVLAKPHTVRFSCVRSPETREA